MPTPPSQKRRIIRVLLYAAVCVIVTGLAAAWFVAGALVAPSPRLIGEPPTGLDVASFSIPSESGSTISGWHTRSDPSAGVIVLVHGIWGSRLSMLSRARMLDELGYSTVMIDLQAHGESPGEQITMGHLEKHDVRAAVAFARREHPQEAVGVIGVSLGGAAALLALPLEIDALVLESVFPNIDDAIHNRVAARLGPLAAIPSALLLAQLQPRLGVSPSQLRPIDHLSDVHCPICILAGAADPHTTASETQAMYSAARDPKELWLVEDAAHVDLLSVAPLQYRERIAGFLARHLRVDQESLRDLDTVW